MKKMLSAILILAMLLAVPTLAMADVPVETQYQLVTCPEGGFNTACELGLKWHWDDENGMVIYTRQEGQLPYMLIYPTGNKGSDFEGYFNDTFTPQMRRNLGDNLLEVSKFTTYNLNSDGGTVALPGVQYTYRNAENRREVLFRLFDTRWSENICYTLRYYEDDADATLRAMGIAVMCFQPTGVSESAPTAEPAPQPTAEPESEIDTEMQKGPRFITCPEQNYSAVCTRDCVTYWQEGTGLYVYTKEWGVVPYVLINVADGQLDIPAFFRDTVAPHMRESYGDDLLEEIDCGNITIGERVMTAMAFRYRLDGDVVYMLRALENRDGFNVSYIMKYFEGAPETRDAVMNALLSISNSFQRDVHYYDGSTIQTGDGTGQSQSTAAPGPQVQGMNGYTVKPAEPIVKNLVKYESGRYSMMIPEGWQVEVSGKTMTFCFKVYDPSNTDRCFFYFNKLGPGLKSQAEKDLFRQYSQYDPTMALMAAAPVMPEGTLTQLLARFGETRAFCQTYASTGNVLLPTVLPDFENPNVLQTWQDERFKYLGPTANTVARIAYTSVATGMGCEGLVSAKCAETMAYVSGVDIGCYSFYGFSGFTAPAGELPELEPVLNQCLSSLQLTREFRDAILDELEADEKTRFIDWNISDSCSDNDSAWNERDESYDIMSQQYSDATLGYDRLYDPDTGEVYRAELGFWDDYDLHRGEYEKSNLQRIDDSSRDYYLHSVDYYINR